MLFEGDSFAIYGSYGCDASKPGVEGDSDAVCGSYGWVSFGAGVTSSFLANK